MGILKDELARTFWEAAVMGEAVADDPSEGNRYLDSLRLATIGAVYLLLNVVLFLIFAGLGPETLSKLPIAIALANLTLPFPLFVVATWAALDSRVEPALRRQWDRTVAEPGDTPGGPQRPGSPPEPGEIARRRQEDCPGT